MSKPLPPWPPAHANLPDTIEEIERGKLPRQLELFGKPFDHSAAARKARLLADQPAKKNP